VGYEPQEALFLRYPCTIHSLSLHTSDRVDFEAKSACSKSTPSLDQVESLSETGGFRALMEEWLRTKNSAKLPRMIDELFQDIRTIHHMERSIRVLELVRNKMQQVKNGTSAGYKKQGAFAEANPKIAKARIYIAVCDKADFSGQGTS
jgi:hypothetical protein